MDGQLKVEIHAPAGSDVAEVAEALGQALRELRREQARYAQCAKDRDSWRAVAEEYQKSARNLAAEVDGLEQAVTCLERDNRDLVSKKDAWRKIATDRLAECDRARGTAVRLEQELARVEGELTIAQARIRELMSTPPIAPNGEVAF